MRQIPPSRRPPYEGGQSRFSKNTNSRSYSGGHSSNYAGNSGGNLLDSMGPEGKIRGTARQIVDRYLALARDALSSSDHVSAEGFFQHAEHYLRILSESNNQQSSFSAPKQHSPQKPLGDGEVQPVAEAPAPPPSGLLAKETPEPALSPPTHDEPKKQPARRPRVYKKPVAPASES